MRFESPAAFALLLLLPLFVPALMPERWRMRENRYYFSAAGLVTPLPRSLRLQFRLFCKQSLRIAAFVLLILALARPQTGNAFVEIRASGRDLLMVLDVSGSMDALDFELEGQRASRLTALKAVTKRFVEERAGDRLGIILFGEQVYTQSPLTLDRSLVAEYIDSLEVGMAGDGTALGDSIAVALQRLQTIEGNSKVLILVTDGVRTAGQLNPLEAAELAAKLGVKVYTIGIGGSGPAPFAATTLFGARHYRYQDVPLDEETLKSIAEVTKGRYFNAQTTEELSAVYQELDQLEPREEIRKEYVEYQEQFAWFAGAATLCVLLFAALRFVIWPEMP